MTLPTSARIGIVGAGAAGLAAAHALVRAGFRNVTVLEKSARVGGKCYTVEHRGRSYELGAGAVTSAYRSVNRLCREHGLQPKAGVGGVFLDDQGMSWLPPPLREGAWGRTAWQLAKLLATLARESRLKRPGFGGLSPELAAPFSEWSRQNGVERATRLMEPWFTGFGYGYFDEIPAAYALKYLLLFRVPVYELLESGYQGLWERVAAPLEVRRNVSIEKIERGDEVVVQTGDGELRFDALILACPLDGILPVLDASDEERALFSAITWNDYHVIAVEMDGPPQARYGFFAEHFFRQKAGEPVFFYRRWLENQLVLYYTCPPAGATLDDSEAAVRRLVGGARLRKVVLRHAWRYFPHVSPAQMGGGYYQRMEALQGRRRTWLTGELLSFTAVESVVAYSEALVARWFTGSSAPG